MWWCIVHLFRLAEGAYDANPSILKCKIKEALLPVAKQYLTVSLEVVLLKERKSCLPFKYLMRWNEIIAKSESLLGTQLILTLNSIPRWWKAGWRIFACKFTTDLENPNYHQKWTARILSKKDFLIYFSGYIIEVTEK